MRRSTAIKIMRGMAMTIVALLIGLTVVIGMLVTKNTESKEDARISSIINQSAWEQICELEHENEIQKQELESLRAQSDINLEYLGEFNCTAYCIEKYEHICGTGSGITASGQPVQAGVSVAVKNSNLPYGTIIYIEGIGIRIVQDTGGGLQSNQIDMAMETHEQALNWGIQQNRKVYIVKVGGNNE